MAVHVSEVTLWHLPLAWYATRNSCPTCWQGGAQQANQHKQGLRQKITLGVLRGAPEKEILVENITVAACLTNSVFTGVPPGIVTGGGGVRGTFVRLTLARRCAKTSRQAVRVCTDRGVRHQTGG
jgi:hypothetical protein